MEFSEGEKKQIQEIARAELLQILTETFDSLRDGYRLHAEMQTDIDKIRNVMLDVLGPAMENDSGSTDGGPKP